MFRVLTCLTTEHDWRLVIVAGVICFLSSLVAVNLFHRATDRIERELDGNEQALRETGADVTRVNGHIELSTRDLPAAKAFYTRVFPWTAKSNPMPEGGEYVADAIRPESRTDLSCARDRTVCRSRSLPTRACQGRIAPRRPT